ncbi:MAG: hypothetical protein A4E65_02125 [Syntrophorhabdus sp. PtaU1.Bin153]|nr:MAG: hypothetical protein A4E65_02125 [Syntrophorhabdus sp. PtaU1.Bin153]
MEIDSSEDSVFSELSVHKARIFEISTDERTPDEV